MCATAWRAWREPTRSPAPDFAWSATKPLCSSGLTHAEIWALLLRDGLPEAAGSGLREAHGRDGRAVGRRVHGPRFPGSHTKGRPHLLGLAPFGASPPRKTDGEAGGELRPVLLVAAPSACRVAAGGRISELSARADHGLLADLLLRRRMLPLLGRRLVAAAPGTVPAEFARRVDVRLV